MRLHRAPTVTALLLAATLTLAACSDDEPREPEPSPTSTATTAAPTPSPSAKPTEPVLPEAAKEPTEAGARAFITYYWDLINYAQVTGDLRGLEAVSGDTCGGCNRAISAVKKLFGGGGHTEGGEYSLVIDRVKKLSSADKALTGMEAAIQVRNRDQVIVSGDGSREISKARTSRYLTYLIWVQEAWRTDVLEPR